MLEKNVYVVTGGAGGIGLAAAERFKDGTVVISDVAPAALEKGKAVLEQQDIDVKTMVCDISKADQVKKMAKEAAALGKVKAVIHSAGVSGDCGCIPLVINVDLLGTYYLIEEFLDVMAEGSSMVLVSSMMADTIPPNQEQDALLTAPTQAGAAEKLEQLCSGDPNLAYDLTKRGVRLLAKKFAGPFGKKGIRINSVSPGIIMTEMAVKAGKEHPEQMKFMESVTPLSRNGRPEEIGNVIAFLCSDKASFITGIDVKADGGAMDAVMALKMKKA